MSKLRINDLESLDSGTSVAVDAIANAQTGLSRRVIYVDTLSDLDSLPSGSLAAGQEVHVNSIDRSYTWDGSSFGLSYDLFIIYGQSNAVGQATAPGDSSKPAFYPDNLDDQASLYWNKTTQAIEPLVYNMDYAGGDKGRGHAWAAFANEYVKATGRGCIFMPGANGGASITTLSKGGAKYSDMAAEVSNLDAALASSDLTVSGRHVLFHQGETDQSDETPRNDYQNLLDTLRSDMAADFNTDKFFLALVGNPQTRDEETWQPIQVAQEYVCTSLADAVLSYADFGSFTLSNKLLRDGVHATQSGYNLMGEGMARSAAEVLEYDLPESSTAQKRYGVINAPEDQIWRQVNFTVQFDETLGQWVPQNRDNSDYRTSCIDFVEVAASDRLRFYLTPRTTAILSMTADLGALNSHLNGTTRLATNISTGATTDTQGVGDVIDVYIFRDLSFFVNDTDQTITTYPDGLAANNELTGVSAASLATGVQIDYPRSGDIPTLTPVSDGTFADPGRVFVGRFENDNIRYLLSGAATSTPKVACSVQGCLINPLHAPDGMRVTVSGIIAEARY